MSGFLISLAILICARGALAADRYVSTTGSGKSCTISVPCSLSDALTNGEGVKINPGDIVWIRGGTYSGSGTHYRYTASTNGTEAAPIIYRGYANERVIVDAKGAQSGAIHVTGTWITFRDIEVLDSDPVRATPSSQPAGIWTNQSGDHLRLVNMIFHDNGSHGAGWWTTNAEIYGCIFYYNGSSYKQHGVYFSQLDPTSTQHLENNIFFDNKGYNIHGYGKNAGHWNVSLENNITFQAGRLASDTPEGAELLLGLQKGETNTPGQNISIVSNYGYATDAKGIGLYIGYEVGNDTIQILRNYFVGGAMRFNASLGDRAIMAGNFLEGPMFNNGFAHQPTSAQWPGNELRDDGGRPSSGKKIVVIPNIYEAGRCHVAVYNWDHSSSVPVDLSSCLRRGDEYAIYWAPKFAAKTAVATGTYSGGAVDFPMTTAALGVMPNPVYSSMMQPPSTTLPEFAAFVVQTTGGK